MKDRGAYEAPAATVIATVQDATLVAVTGPCRDLQGNAPKSLNPDPDCA